MDNEKMEFVEMSDEELDEIMGGFRIFNKHPRMYDAVKVTCDKCGKSKVVSGKEAATLFTKREKCACGGNLRYSKPVTN